MPLAVFAYIGIPVALLLHGGTLWWISKFPSKVPDEASVKASSQDSITRTHLIYSRTLRLGLFLSSFLYLIVITTVTAVARSGPVVKTRAVGLLACCLFVAAKFWITALTFVPYFAQLNIKYNTQITECMWILQNLVGYSAIGAGLSVAGSFHCSTASWALMSLLMSAPVEVIVPVQLVEVVMYTMLHVAFHHLSAAHCLSLMVQYLLLGVVLPATCTHFLDKAPTQIQVPYALHLSSSVVLGAFNMFHLMLSSTSIAHSIQDNAASSWLSGLLSGFMQPPLGTAKYGYGLSSSISIPVILGLFMVLALIRGAMAFEASQAWPAWRDSCMKHPVLSVLLQLILSLPRWKKLVLAGLAGITVIQALAMKGMVVLLLLEGSNLLPDLGSDSTFIFLPSILIALLLQFVAVGLLLLPSEQQTLPPSPAAKYADAPSTSLSATPPTATAAAAQEGAPAALLTAPSVVSSIKEREDFARSDSHVGSPGLSSQALTSQTLNSLDTLGERGLVPVLRDVALAAAQPTAGQVVLPSTMDKPTIVSHLQEFTRGLHELQPQQQGARQFVGMANASVQALFPGVKYASMSVLSLESAQEVYITVLLGAGMNQPKMAVKVVPCTLLVYVLDSGQAVFISNTDTFVGPFSDVQFMRMAVGLRAVACLPLLWRDGDAMQVYGAVLMGFPEPRTWTDEDKKYAKQLAMILAEGIPLLDAEEPVQPYSPSTKINNALVNSGESHVVSSPSAASYASDAAHYPRSPGRQLSEARTSTLSLNGSVPRNSIPQSNGASGLTQSQEGELKLMEIIGRGGFGSVYKGIYHGQEVAVKVLEHGEDFMGCADDPLGNSHGSGGGDDAAAALSEGRMTLNIRHPNVVQTYDLKVVDLTSTPDGNNGPRGSLQQTRIIMEFCDRGCLQDAVDRGLLHAGLPSEGGVPDLEAIVLTLAEVASALAHLHANNITHRDLKPKNILLKTANKDRRGFTTKVSDFGLSQVLKDNEGTFISSKYGGTITHMPPELLEEGRVYPMGDVYAFGIIMWEVYTGATPYANMVRPQIMVGVVTHNLRPKFPESCPEWYRSLAYRCWRKDPKQRPSFTNVTAQLQNILYERLWERK